MTCKCYWPSQHRQTSAAAKGLKVDCDWSPVVCLTSFDVWQDLVNACKRRGEKLEEWFVAILAIHLIDIVHLMHRCNIIHADFKPDNILVTQLWVLPNTAGDIVTCRNPSPYDLYWHLYIVVWSRELGGVENECTSRNFSLFPIVLPKIIKMGGNLTKFWQKQFCTVFPETPCSFTWNCKTSLGKPHPAAACGLRGRFMQPANILAQFHRLLQSKAFWNKSYL